MKINWHYHRPGCQTCKKMENFLEARKLKSAEVVNATKERKGEAEILELARSVNRILVTKGQKVHDINMKKEAPDDETLLKYLMGPSGNLRAPTLVVGKTLVVGFNEEEFAKFFDQQ